MLETLGAHEALLMVKLPVTVHYLLYWVKATLAALTHGIGQRIGHVAEEKKKNVFNQGQRALLKLKSGFKLSNSTITAAMLVRNILIGQESTLCCLVCSSVQSI